MFVCWSLWLRIWDKALNWLDCFQIDQTIYDAAKVEVESLMRNETYPLFLKSDIYLTYVQHGGGDSPKTSNNSSGSDGTRPLFGLPLPTVHEERELKTADIHSAVPQLDSCSVLTETSLVATQWTRNAQLPRRFVYFLLLSSCNAQLPLRVI